MDGKTIFEEKPEERTRTYLDNHQQSPSGQKGGITMQATGNESLPTESSNETTQTERMEEKLDALIEQSQQMLFKTQSTFPFDLFPDIVSIDISQVHITSKQFFKSKRIHSIAIKDISDVFVETAPFFATLKIIDKDFIENSVSVSHLPKKDAVKAKKIIQGLMLGTKEGVDFSQIHDEQLVPKLEDLGSPKTQQE